MAWYVATQLDDPSWQSLLARVLAEAGVSPAAVVPAGVEVVRRSGDGASYLFVFDHTGEEQLVPADGVELLTGDTVRGTVRVPARGAAVVRERQR